MFDDHSGAKFQDVEIEGDAYEDVVHDQMIYEANQLRIILAVLKGQPRTPSVKEAIEFTTSKLNEYMEVE